MGEPNDGRQRIPPRAAFEEEVGFTRGIRIGNRVEIAGTIGIEADGSVSTDTGRQAERCYELIAEYLEELGSRLEDVVRVRMFVTDIADADAVSAAFTKALKPTRPTGTLVAITALYDPRIKVEIEAEAVVGNG